MYPYLDMAGDRARPAESEVMTDLTPTTDDQHARVVVIGAGQAGLSVAYHLRRLGLEPGTDLVVLDRAPSTGGAWQFRWEALRLGSAHRVHDLPGMRAMGLAFEDADRSRPARDVVGAYYRRFEEHYGLRVRRPVAVTSVTRTTGGLCVATRTADGHEGRIHAEVVVNASGTWGTPFVPWYPGRDTFAGRQLDTTEYRSAAEFQDQDVVVVGGGTSAIGFLLELDGVARSTRWFTRRPMTWSDTSALDLESAVAAVDEQDRAARAGEVLPSIVSGTGVPVSRRIRAGLDRGVLRDERVFARIEPSGVVTADGEHVHADAIVWATGFRADLRHLAPLHLRTAKGGVVVADGRSAEEPRLFLAGYGPQASTIGANRAGRLIARQVMDELAAS
ncbi:cation diffusion facilitator CzcD-associated flavoprotein CzcO [Curtobacterium sp. ZW137]|nr:cation diffusion facilitator CzcD-associated flavoprotein CzcO [Curtobacterium sp. ZW137]